MQQWPREREEGRKKNTQPLYVHLPSHTALLLHFLVKPTDEGLRCTSIPTAFPSLSLIRVWSCQVSRYQPRGRLWLCGRRHLQMWAHSSSWEFQEFQVINLSDLHPFAKHRERSQNPPRVSFQTSTLYTLPVELSTSSAWRVHAFVSSLSFLCLDQQNTPLLSHKKKKKKWQSCVI